MLLTTALVAGALNYGPILVDTQKEVWPEALHPWTIAGLIEAESCISLTHSKCWNPKSELKTHREYGFGFGQITIAYREDGSTRFNKFEELTSRYTSLQDWAFEDRFDPEKQLTAVVEMVHSLWNRVWKAGPAQDLDSQWSFVLSSYNGGFSALQKDRLYCKNIQGCNPDVWSGNVETHSLKSKTPQAGYGNRSWYEINRNHARKILVKRDKYMELWQ